MNLFELGRKGVRICLCIGLKHDQKIALHIKTISYQVSGNLTEIKELCEDLVKAGILKRDSIAAKSYLLALNPNQIKLGNIVKVCEKDETLLTDCNIARQCPVNSHCFFDKKLWGSLLEATYSLLDQITLQNYIDNVSEISYVAPPQCWLAQLKD